MTPSSDHSVADDATRAANALDRLGALHPKLIDLGLDRTFALLDDLGNPHTALPPTIHVAGTNGKGSTIAQMRAMAEAAGLRVHVYSSPHLCHFNERIRLASNLISDGALADLLEEVETKNGDKPVTFFEVTTAAAMLAFSRVPADLLLLETGLGGMLDSTNVLDAPAATIITPIARDHEHFLGSDIGGIAGQKAGIMRAGVACFSAAQPADAAAALRAYADEIGTEIAFAGPDFQIDTHPNGGITLQFDGAVHQMPAPSLPGAHQHDNAALAARALLHVATMTGWDCTAETLLAGLNTAQWPGRVQCLDHGALVTLAGGSPIWLDGAHNGHGAAALAATLPTLDDQEWVVICGALNTRDPREFLAPLSPLVTSVHCLTILDQDAALSKEDMVAAARELGMDAHGHDSVTAAIRHIHNDPALASAPLVICGSLYLAGHVLLENKTPPQ